MKNTVKWFIELAEQEYNGNLSELEKVFSAQNCKVM